MMLLSLQHVGTAKTYRLDLADADGVEHPIAIAEWRIVAHETPEGEQSPRPLASVTPVDGGRSAIIKAHAWPGRVEIQIVAHAMERSGSMGARSTMFADRIVLTVVPVPEISDTLRLRVIPEGITK